MLSSISDPEPANIITSEVETNPKCVNNTLFINWHPQVSEKYPLKLKNAVKA